MRAMSYLIVSGGLLLGLTHCSTNNPQSSTPGIVCVPGATRVCVGPGDCQGTQMCGTDGRTWSDCNCGSDAAVTNSSIADGGLRDAGSVNSPGCGQTKLPAACNTTTTGPCSIDVNGLSRQYFVVLPANYNANTATPVVFAWHARGWTAADILVPPGSAYYGPGGAFYGVISGFPNAIYIAGQGLDSSMTDGGTDHGWLNYNGEDVNFAEAMVSWVEANFCVDESRIFSTGMSAGGLMSDTLGCQLPDVFRAIGVMSGALLYGSCVNQPIAAFITHGTADNLIDISYDEAARDQFIKDNGCDTTNTQSVVLDANTTCTLYNVCTAGNYPVEWCPVAGGDHSIPSWSGAQIAKFFLQF